MVMLTKLRSGPIRLFSAPGASGRVPAPVSAGAAAAGGAGMAAAEPTPQPLTVILPLARGDSLLRLAAQLEPLILAADCAPARLQWQLRSIDGQPVRLAGGAVIEVAHAFTAPQPPRSSHLAASRHDGPQVLIRRSLALIAAECGSDLAQLVGRKLGLGPSALTALTAMSAPETQGALPARGRPPGAAPAPGASGAAAASPDLDPAAMARDPRVAEAVRRMHARLAEPETAAEIARTLGLSPRRLEGLFRAEFGIGPGGYALDLRLEAAREALAGSRRTVGEIAAATGFSSAGTLARAFRRRYGISPSDLRRRDR